MKHQAQTTTKTGLPKPMQYKFDEENKALHIKDGSRKTVFKKGSLVRVYSTFFSKKEPNDVDRSFYRDILIDEVESPLSTHYYIVFRGVDLRNPNTDTNRSDFSISKRCTSMRFIEKLDNHQFKLELPY